MKRLTERNPGVPLFWLGLAMVGVLMLPMLIGFLWLSKRLLDRATSWIGVRRVPNEEDRRAATIVTSRLTMWSAPWWASRVRDRERS